MVLLGLAAFCAFAPLELPQLLCGVFGAAFYLFMRGMQASLERPLPRKKKTVSPVQSPRQQGAAAVVAEDTQQQRRPVLLSRGAELAGAKTKSAVPVKAPVFAGAGWEAEISELVGRLTPTQASHAAVAEIGRSVQRALRPILPGVKVFAHTSASLNSGAAFGVAVPDVEIVVQADAQVLEEHLSGTSGRGRRVPSVPDAQKLQKPALRACTDRLVGTAGFKFRRSAFRGEEPKVTLLAPTSLPSCLDQAVPVSLSVNTVLPQLSAAFLEECGRRHPQAKDLILLVRRWAKDRGISHVAKGHLSPYAWTVLVVHFLQVGLDQGPLLPPVEEFVIARRRGVSSGAAEGAASSVNTSDASLGDLFKSFFHFYAGVFDWKDEAVVPRLGRRVAATQVRMTPCAASQAPLIEDPLHPGQNLASGMNTESVPRLHEEFRRAEDLCTAGASLSSLLEPWVPAEFETKDEQ